MKRMSFLAFVLMFLGVLAISCGSRPTPASVTPLPTIYIPEMSDDWRVAYYESLTGQLCVMDVNGRDKVCLEESIPDNSYHGSAWSPDGNQMLISKDKLGMYFWEPGGNFTTFRNSTADETFHEIDWSPKGDFIAYASTELFRRCETCQAYYHDIFIDSLDGSVHRHITAQFTSASSPDWAPDGQSIVFDADGEIFLFSLYADKAFNLTQHDANEMSPKWSPDGRFIAFLSDRAGLATLYVMNSDGLEAREVADLDINLYGEGLEPEPTQVYTYTWLPDGKRILYSSTIFTPTTERRDYIYINKLIDIETGNIVDVQLPFEGSLAAWYMPSNLEIVPSYQTPLPFEAVSEMPSGEFLFVFLHDDDFTCLDGLCACPVPEMPPDPFKFEGDQLLLAKQDFEPMPDDWIAFRKNRQASILYSFYGSQVSELRLFSSLPLTTPVGNFMMRGVNARGEILVQTPDGPTVIAVGRNAYSQEPEQRDEGCKVLHKYSLTNYGFIKDEDVRLVTGW